MTAQIELVLLTKSHKDNNYCVAGIDCYTGQWIRLVSVRDNNCGAIPREYMDGIDVLDIVSVPVLGGCPARYQCENVLIDEHRPLRKIGEMSLRDAIRLHPLERRETVLDNYDAYLAQERMDEVGHSLEMIEVWKLTLYPSILYRNKASFTYNNRMYDKISVTDPRYYSARNEKIGHAALVLSLPNKPYKRDGLYYKFIARIFPL